MTLRAPEPLGPEHQIAGFDCGKESLNSWLIRHSRQAQAAGSAKTFVVADQDEVVGYYSLAVGQVSALDAPERIRKGMGAYPIPVILLARLAIRAGESPTVCCATPCDARWWFPNKPGFALC